MYLVQIESPRDTNVLFDFVFECETDAQIFKDRAEANRIEATISPYYEPMIWLLEEALEELDDMLSYWKADI